MLRIMSLESVNKAGKPSHSYGLYTHNDEWWLNFLIVFVCFFKMNVYLIVNAIMCLFDTPSVLLSGASTLLTNHPYDSVILFPFLKQIQFVFFKA